MRAAFTTTVSVILYYPHLQVKKLKLRSGKCNLHPGFLTSSPVFLETAIWKERSKGKGGRDGSKRERKEEEEREG